jgi:5-methylcytosine-specific restriction endonuclease McrA
MNTSCLRCGRVIRTGARCQCEPTRNGSTRAWRDLRAHVLLRDRQTCRYCGVPATHVDHVLPISRGGPTHPDNLVAACQRCNLQKGAA